MESVPTSPPAAEFAPVAANQRIDALDVVRGFALIGVFLMNIEFFNRTFGSFNEGMPRGLTGLDWLASWFINYLVQGKFWTIFSLLFGMGFAVMLVRAERAGREFKQVYLRRILGLAVFGALHYIFIWEGDILFSYAVAALGLLIVLYGKPEPILVGCAVLLGLGFIPGLDDFFGVLAGLVMAGLFALYLRDDERFTRLGLSIPLFSLIVMTIGAVLSIAAVVFWLIPDGPTGPRLPLSIFGPLVLIAGWMSWKYYDPLEKRSVRLAVSVYLFSAFAMTAAGLSQHFGPDPTVVPAGAEQVATKKDEAKAVAEPAANAAIVSAPAAAAPGEKASDKATTQTDGKKEKPKKTKAERAAEAKAERAKELAENAAKKAEELKLFTSGSYLATVEWRARKFLEKAAGDAGFGIVLIGMFLLGVWFVRSGVMENTGAHLAFFKKLALYGLPIGIGIGLLGSAIAMSHTPGDRTDGWGIARGLLNIGNLPACLGYVGLVVVMLHSNTVFSRIRLLAPLGRMALTAYLMQSIICAIYFYGFALGHWGMPRSQQMLFVLVVYSLQVAFSHWWLSRFKYGPMEWLWRGFTYRQIPAFRNTPNAGAVAA